MEPKTEKANRVWCFGLAIFLVMASQVQAGLPDTVLRQITQGRIADLPSAVAVGLLDPDPLLDAAHYSDGTVTVYRNLGNGTFSPVWERRVAGEVERMEWQKTRVFPGGIPDISSWANLHIFYSDGRSEVLSHDEIILREPFFASAPSIPMGTSLDFREVWRSEQQSAGSSRISIADIDGDGRTEMVYAFHDWGFDSMRLVIYECVGNDSFVVDWDTVLSSSTGGPGAITDVDGDGRKEIVLFRSGAPSRLVLLECLGPGQYSYYETNITYSAPPYAVLESDINYNGIKELVLHTSNFNSPQYATTVYVAEFSHKDTAASMMWFNIWVGRFLFHTYGIAVGQVDGVGAEEIVLVGYAPLDYLWYNGVEWRPRRSNVGLAISASAPMFVNLDADPMQELFIGGIGPIGHGSCYALKWVSDTTWTVLWVDSSLRNTPLSVNAGVLDGQFVVAGVNTWDITPADTYYTQLHVYTPAGVKLGIWQRDTSSVQRFHFLDIDNDGRTNLVAAIRSHRIPGHLGVYEYYGPTDVGETENDQPLTFALLQNFPNPFNPSTRIVYRVGSPATAGRREFVELKVYDVLGREMAVLVNEKKEPGEHTVEWNAEKMPSGVYFYRLMGEKHTFMRKMMLIR